MKRKISIKSVLAFLLIISIANCSDSTSVELEKDAQLSEDIFEKIIDGKLYWQTGSKDSVDVDKNLNEELKSKYSGNLSYGGDTEWYNFNTNYNLDDVDNRVVAGDFDGDGSDDIATMYDYGSSETALHVFLSQNNFNAFNTRSFDYQGDNGWWHTNPGGYHPNLCTGRITSGDFNGDNRDDIACFYRYSGSYSVHVWLSTGTSFTYQGNNGWYNAAGYEVNNITDRVISGDFNNDGYDDLAAFYDYSSSNDVMHVWLSNGTSFTYQGNNGWWAPSQYNSQNATGRMASGDYDGDNRDDIVLIYDYPSNDKAHILLSNGSSFIYQGNNGWRSFTSDVKTSNYQVVAGFFNSDTYADIATIKKPDGYVSVSQMSMAPFDQWPFSHIYYSSYQSNGSSFLNLKGGYFGYFYQTQPIGTLVDDYFDPNLATLVSGDFDGDGITDLAVFGEVQVFDYLTPYIPRTASSFFTTDIKVVRF